jgi:transposase-like protein
MRAELPGTPHPPGLDRGECESEAFWGEFLRGLVKRGLSGAARRLRRARGLEKAIGQVLGSTCSSSVGVPLSRDLLSTSGHLVDEG